MSYISQKASGDAEASGSSTYAAARRGNVGIGAKVNVEHESVGPFDHHFFAGRERCTGQQLLERRYIEK
jgi:hypothetical protein